MNIDKSQLTLLLEIDGQVYLVGMEKEKLETIEFLVKRSVAVAVPTKKTQQELNVFLNYKPKEQS